MTYEEIQEEIKYQVNQIKRSRKALEGLYILREEKRNEDQITIDEILRP